MRNDPATDLSRERYVVEVDRIAKAECPIFVKALKASFRTVSSSFSTASVVQPLAFRRKNLRSPFGCASCVPFALAGALQTFCDGGGLWCTSSHRPCLIPV